jgi:hypothetical protein
VTYRDDREAMLARLTVLEREAVELAPLRARVAELEADNRWLAARVAELEARLAPPAPPAPAAGAGVPQIAFRIRDRSGERELASTEPTIKIGRLPSAHLRIDDAQVSRLHAIIENGETGALIIDLGSSGGTWVNGARVNKAELADGDLIQIGQAQITVGLPR